MSQCICDKKNLSWRPSSAIELHKCKENFEKRFVVRSLQNFPPQLQQQQQQGPITTTKSTTCICRKCSRSTSPSPTQPDPGQQMFEHLIAKGRKPERLLVPDLATEWFRKQKNFLDKVTDEERHHSHLDASVSFSTSCDCSHSKLQHRVQYLDYRQELRRRQLLFRRQKQQQRDGIPICHCSDPPNWPPPKKKKTKIRFKQEQVENSTDKKQEEINSITVCAPQMADKSKPFRATGGSKTESCLYPHRICSCEERLRRRNSCSCIFQADGQPMAEECLGAIRTESSMPRLRKKYNLRQVPHRRLNPRCFRRISPEFYRLLKSYEDDITEKYPLYGMPTKFWTKTIPCCSCECATSAPSDGIEPCPVEECVVPDTEACPNQQTVIESEEVTEQLTTELESNDCDGCQNETCANPQCEGNSGVLEESGQDNGSESDYCNDRTCQYRSQDNISIGTSSVATNETRYVKPILRGFTSKTTEYSGISRHLEKLRSGFSYEPQPYRPPTKKPREPKRDYGEQRIKRKGVLGSFAGVCKRALFPGRYLLYNFSTNFQRQPSDHQKHTYKHSTEEFANNSGVRNDKYDGKVRNPNQYVDYSDERNELCTTNSSAWNAQQVTSSSRRDDQYTAHSGGRTKQSTATSGERNDHYAVRSSRKNEDYTAHTGESKEKHSAHSGGRKEKHSAHSGGRNNEYKQSTEIFQESNDHYSVKSSRRNEDHSAHSGGRKEKHLAHSGKRNDPYWQSTTNPSVHNNSTTLQSKCIDQQSITDSDVTITQCTVGETAGYRTPYCSFIDNPSQSESAVTIIQVMADSRENKNNTTAKSGEKTVNNENVTKPNSGGTDSKLNTEPEKQILKERRAKTPRVNCRRSFTPVSDYEQVMRLMGRKRNKPQSSKRSTATLTDRKRTKTDTVETNRNLATNCERDRNISQSVKSTTVVKRPEIISKKRNPTSTEIEHLIAKSPAQKMDNRLQYVDEEEIQKRTTVRHSEDSAESSGRKLSIHNIRENITKKIHDDKRIEKQRESSEKTRPLNKEQLRRKPETQYPKYHIREALSDVQKEVSNQTWKQPIPKFNEVNPHERYQQYSGDISSQGTSETSQFSLSNENRSRYTSKLSIKLPSIRMNRKARKEEKLTEHSVDYNSRIVRDQRKSPTRTISGQSITSIDNDSNNRRRPITINNNTSLDTIEHEEECLGNVVCYRNQASISKDIERNTPEFYRKKSGPSALPTLFTFKPPRNEKLIRKREAMEKAWSKPKVYLPQRMMKQISLLTRRPAARILRSFTQEQSQRWQRIQSMMKQNEDNLQHQEMPLKSEEQPYDRPLHIGGRNKPNLMDLDGHEMISTRSRSGCDAEFQDRQKRKLIKDYATPFSSASNLRSQDFVACQGNEKENFRRFSGEERLEEPNEQEEIKARKSHVPFFKDTANNFTSAGYELVKHGRQESLQLATGPSNFHSPLDQRMRPLIPINQVSTFDRSPAFSESFGYPQESDYPRTTDSCQAKCQHFGNTNYNRTCPAQLSSILKSPSKHFKSSNEGRRVNFVGPASQQLNASIHHPDYQHTVHNGVYAGTCGCSSVSVKSGTRRPSVVRAHTVHSNTEPPILADQGHNFTFLNQQQTPRAEGMLRCRTKPQTPSLFAVPVTPTVDPDYLSNSFESSYGRLPYAKLEEEDGVEKEEQDQKNHHKSLNETHLPMNSQLLSNRADYRPSRVAFNNPAMPRPVSLVSELDFNTHCARTRVMTPGQQREEGGTEEAGCPPTAVSSFMDQLRIQEKIKRMRDTRAACPKNRSTNSGPMNASNWISSFSNSGAGTIEQQNQRSPYDCIARTESSDYYPRRRCFLRRLPEEPVVIAPTHGALREQQILQRVLPVLFYGRQR